MNIKTANRLCDLRKKHGYSQEELAAKLGVSRQAVSKWERSESSPDTDNLIELAKLYNVSLDELLNEDGAEEIIEENKESDKEQLKEEVKDSKEKMEFTDDEGNTVIIKDKKVTLINSEGESKEMSKDEWKEKMFYKKHPVLSVINGCWTMGIVIAYILLGFLLPGGEGWANYWFLFILIPVVPSIMNAIRKRRSSEFVYPCLVAAVYCALGMFINGWHPWWVIFLTIPVFYVITGAIDSTYKRNHPNQAKEKDFE